jgi:hypothetical protein
LVLVVVVAHLRSGLLHRVAVVMAAMEHRQRFLDQALLTLEVEAVGHLQGQRVLAVLEVVVMAVVMAQ